MVLRRRARAFATEAHRYVQRTATEFKLANKASFVTSFLVIIFSGYCRHSYLHSIESDSFVQKFVPADVRPQSTRVGAE